jgi:hypothetical protein
MSTTCSKRLTTPLISRTNHRLMPKNIALFDVINFCIENFNATA